MSARASSCTSRVERPNPLELLRKVTSCDSLRQASLQTPAKSVSFVAESFIGRNESIAIAPGREPNPSGPRRDDADRMSRRFTRESRSSTRPRSMVDRVGPRTLVELLGHRQPTACGCVPQCVAARWPLMLLLIGRKLVYGFQYLGEGLRVLHDGPPSNLLSRSSTSLTVRSIETKGWTDHVSPRRPSVAGRFLLVRVLGVAFP